MAETDTVPPLLNKAEQSLVGAETAYAGGRYDNAANRAYYACFQAAVVALRQAGVQPSGGKWGHGSVQAQFGGLFINRRKRYPSELRDVLPRLFRFRQRADYDDKHVTQTEAGRAIRDARRFVTAVRGEGGASQCRRFHPHPTQGSLAPWTISAP